jgi:DNA-binding response OmpR family regulator
MAAILIVEDDEPLAWAEARILRQAGHTPIVTTNARAALQEAAERPDLILLDLGLPDLPGQTLLRQLRKQPQTARIPVLIITGLPELAAQLDMAEEGNVVDILLKPFSTARLCQMVETALAHQPAPAPDEESQTHHLQQELIRHLIEGGSDALVFHVYRRLHADRITPRTSKASDALTWTEIAEWARQERLLDAEQARLLRSRQPRPAPKDGPAKTA